MEFINRFDAGQKLGALLRTHRPADPLVIGLARGGVPVALEVARVLEAPLEVHLVRKLVAPGPPPVTIGAIAEGPAVYLDEAEVARLGLRPAAVGAIIDRERAELARLGTLLRDGPPLDVQGRDVILVDDGAITGGTIQATVMALRERRPRTLVLALPVGASEIVDRLRPGFDRVVCLVSDPLLVSVGSRYQEFWQVSEAEVATLLATRRREWSGDPHR